MMLIVLDFTIVSAIIAVVTAATVVFFFVGIAVVMIVNFNLS